MIIPGEAADYIVELEGALLEAAELLLGMLEARGGPEHDPVCDCAIHVFVRRAKELAE